MSEIEAESLSDAEEVEFSLRVVINKEKSKVLFAEADSHFTDILLSFLTLPLGRIVRIIEKHYGAFRIGSLNTLYHSLVNLDTSHFWTEGAKKTMVNPTSSFEAEYEKLKLDFSDSEPAKYFFCGFHPRTNRFRSVSIYYDSVSTCHKCSNTMNEEVSRKGSEAATGDGVFTIPTASFIISDDLQILPYETGLLGVLSTLSITETEEVEQIKVTFGFNEIMNLLKTSLTSQTPLSDLILNKTSPANSITVESEPRTSINQIEEDPNSKQMNLKLMLQKSNGMLLHAQVEEDFVELLISFLNIPMGGVEQLVGGKTGMKAIDNLYLSTTDHIDDKYFKSQVTKERLMKPNLVHGCISKDHILPLTEEPLPANYSDNLSLFSSVKFPKGQGNYIKGPRIYQVTDELYVTPFGISSILSSLNGMNIPVSDVEEVEMQIGLKEVLCILKASLTSTSALTDALLSPSNRPAQTNRNRRPEPGIESELLVLKPKPELVFGNRRMFRRGRRSFRFRA